MTSFIAAAVQMVSDASLENNLKQAAKWIAQGVDQGAQLILLPETFSLFQTQGLRPLAEQEQQQQTVQLFLAEQARQHGIVLVGGTTPMTCKVEGGQVAGSRVRAASMVYGGDGALIGRYDKIHLFDVDVADAQGAYRESNTMDPGEQVVVVDTPLAKLGLSVCYDLRFPELYRQLVYQGAEVLLVPAAFTATTGAAHWNVLLRARAIENQCYVIAADQGGIHNQKRHTHGESMIIDPWGEVLNSVKKGPGVVCANIDLERLQQVRTQLPALKHAVLQAKIEKTNE